MRKIGSLRSLSGHIHILKDTPPLRDRPHLDRPANPASLAGAETLGRHIEERDFFVPWV